MKPPKIPNLILKDPIYEAIYERDDHRSKFSNLSSWKEEA